MWLNKTGFLSSRGRLQTKGWMHYIDTKKKVNANYKKILRAVFEEILKTTPHKTAAVWPLTSNLKNHTRKTNKTSGTWLEKQGASGGVMVSKLD